MSISTGSMTAAFVIALLVPASLAAQGQQAHHPDSDSIRASGRMGMMSDGMGMQTMGMHGMGMMRSHMQRGPAMLLRQREALDLSNEQIERLEELEGRVDDLHSAHRSELAPVREQLKALHGSEKLDKDRYEELLQRQADLRVKMMVEMADVHQASYAVLTDEQKSNVRYGMRLMHSMRVDAEMSHEMPGGGMMENMGDGMGVDGSGMMQKMRGMHQQMHEDCPLNPSQEADGVDEGG